MYLKHINTVATWIQTEHILNDLNHDYNLMWSDWRQVNFLGWESYSVLTNHLLQATFKRYQMEHKMKQDSLEKSQSDLKKLRRKSQGKNANKYENKESEVR